MQSQMPELNPFATLRRGSVSPSAVVANPAADTHPIVLSLRGNKAVLEEVQRFCCMWIVLKQQQQQQQAVKLLNAAEFRLVWDDEAVAGADAVLVAPPTDSSSSGVELCVGGKADFVLWLDASEPPPSSGAIHVASIHELLGMLVAL
jgi:hypothetical protein